MKAGSRWLFSWRPGREEEVMRVFGRYAGDRDLDFTWADAAALTRRVRQQKAEWEKEKKHRGTEATENTSDGQPR